MELRCGHRAGLLGTGYWHAVHSMQQQQCTCFFHFFLAEQQSVNYVYLKRDEKRDLSSYMMYVKEASSMTHGRSRLIAIWFISRGQRWADLARRPAGLLLVAVVVVGKTCDERQIRSWVVAWRKRCTYPTCMDACTMNNTRIYDIHAQVQVPGYEYTRYRLVYVPLLSY